jgi:hypothetical protein
VHQAGPALAGKAARCSCGTVLHIPAAGAAATQPFSQPSSQPVSQGSASIFDQLSEEDLAPQPSPQAPSQRPLPKSDWQVLSQYTDIRPPKKAESARHDGFFAPEKRGLDYGMVGGIIMMLIAVLWFFGGLVFGVIFFYPPILFLIGLFGLLKGLFTGNFAGKS